MIKDNDSEQRPLIVGLNSWSLMHFTGLKTLNNGKVTNKN